MRRAAIRRPAAQSATAAAAFDLNLRHLSGLLAVRAHGGISAAAPTVGLSQPALTQGVRRLEAQLGAELFERLPEGMVASATGELVLGRVEAFLAHLRRGARELTGTAFEPERRLTMTQLRAYLAVVRCGSFALAAQEQALSQPAVHRAVRDLEHALGRQLVERRGRGIHVNFSGRRFARSCRLAMGELQAAISEIGLDPQDPVICIGSTPLARAFLVPEAMATLVAQGYPAGFRVLEGSWGELAEQLRDGTIDLIVGELPAADVPDLATVPLYQEAPLVVAGRQHPLALGGTPPVQALRSYPWIIAPENSPLRSHWENLFQGSRPHAPIECESIMIIGRLLTSSSLLTLAMPDQVALQIRSGLLAAIGPPLSGSAPTVGATMRQGWRPTRAQRHFLDKLQEAAATSTGGATRKAVIRGEWV